jgi:hypothetical protein
MTTSMGGDVELAQLTLRNQFVQHGVDWHHPTKEGVLLVMGSLKDKAGSFRDPEVIRENYLKMLTIVNKCTCTA